MEFVTLFISGFMIGLTGAMSPGQDTMLVLHCVTRGGRSAGVRASMGIGVALLFHASLTLLIIFVLDKTIGRIARQTLQVAGVFYLVYFAYQLLSHHSEGIQEVSREYKKRSYFINGFFNNLFNSKALLFFTAIVLPFIDPEKFTGGVVFLIGIVTAIPLWFIALSIGLSKVIDRITPKWYRAIEIISGLLFLGIAFYGIFTLINE